MKLKLKTALQTATRKTLEGIDKGLAFGEKHPVAVERTLLIAGTYFITRRAYKNFAPSSAIAEPLEDLTELRKIFHLDKPMDIVRTAAPLPANDAWVGKLFHLEFSDFDLEDMKVNGLGLIFNIKETGHNDFPLALVSYARLKPLLEGAGAPLNNVAEEILASQA